MAKTRLFQQLQSAFRAAWNEQAPPASSDLRLSRRAFLKGSLGAVGLWSAAYSLPNLTLPAWAIPPQSAPVVIVGAGLAGLVAAYRLHQQGVPCAVYEGNTRVGGRTWTHQPFNAEAMFCELGAELVDTGHQALITLCEHLGLGLERFDQAEPPHIAPGELYWVGGKLRGPSEVVAAFEPLARAMVSDLQVAFPDGLSLPTYREPAQSRGLDRLSLSQYLRSKPGVAPWLTTLLEVAYTGEYGLDPDQQSALNLLCLIGLAPEGGFKLFGESDEAMRIQGGSSRLVDALTRELTQAGVPLYTGHRLKHLASRQGELRLGFLSAHQYRDVRCAHAILAIPFSVLRHVDGVGQLPLSAVKHRAIQTWGMGSNSKRMLGFDRRFWRDGMTHPRLGAIAAHPGSLVTDTESQCFWETSRCQPGAAGILTNFLGGAAGRRARAGSVDGALRHLDEVYDGQARAHFDGQTMFWNWSRNPWSAGSYTCPKPGQYTTLMGAAGEPELDGHLLFAGEHCSVEHAGFMNGAVASGNTAAAQLMTQLADSSRPIPVTAAASAMVSVP